MNFIEIGPISPSIIPFVLIISTLWIILVYLSYKTYGIKATLRLFLPMMIAALFLEAAAVANGRYTYPGYLLNIHVLQGSIPLIILMGWGVNLFLFMHLSDYLVNHWYKHNNYLRYIFVAIGASFIGIFLDLFEDPLAHHNNWWVWTETTSTLRIFDVPYTNYLDWFLIMFFFTLTTQLIHNSQLTENRKIIVSINTVPLLGGIIFGLHYIVVTIIG